MKRLHIQEMAGLDSPFNDSGKLTIVGLGLVVQYVETRCNQNTGAPSML